MTNIWTPESVDPTKLDYLEFDPRAQRMDGIAHHGNTPFNVPYISQIDETLFVGGCRDGLVLPRDIFHVVSLYPWETYKYHDEVRSVLQVTMYDSLDQSTDQLSSIAAWVNACRADGGTLVHCQAGLNRSNLVAATALKLQGMSGDEAVTLLREKRSPAVLCNPSFEKHLVSS